MTVALYRVCTHKTWGSFLTSFILFTICFPKSQSLRDFPLYCLFESLVEYIADPSSRAVYGVGLRQLPR